MEAKFLEKTEIAGRQIHGAIRAFLSSDDPLVVSTLAFPALQILRDLNKNNTKAMSKVISDIFTELAEGHFDPPSKIVSKLWSEFNQTANMMKHANDSADHLDFNKLAGWNNQTGLICFSIMEYQANLGGVTPLMFSFCSYLSRQNNRIKKGVLWCGVRDAFDRRIILWRQSFRQSFFTLLLIGLTALKGKLDSNRLDREVN